jgi:hypothetical protein
MLWWGRWMRGLGVVRRLRLIGRLRGLRGLRWFEREAGLRLRVSVQNFLPALELMGIL